MTMILEARAVKKRLGATQALTGVDLEVPAGRITCVLGRNGAGKSTLVRLAATLLKPDSGTLEVAGVDVDRHPHVVRRLIGLAGQAAAVEPSMTGRENLELMGRLFGLDRRRARTAATAALSRLALSEVGDDVVKTYSGGMRRRLDLGLTLVGSPRLLLLDEPTTGLDPGSRLELWACVGDLVAEGTSVLLTTQHLEEADRLADQIVVLDHGSVVSQGTPRDLKARCGHEVLTVELRDPADRCTAASALARLSTGALEWDGDEPLCLPVTDGPARLGEALRELNALGVAVRAVGVRPPTLDEVFLTLTRASGPPAPSPVLASVAEAPTPVGSLTTAVRS